MKKVYLVADLGFGDSGKGTIVEFLVRYFGAKLIVRYNGGPQSAHNIVCINGVHHCFAQFGSGMLIPGVETYISKHMLVNPISLVNEAMVLIEKTSDNVFARLVIDEDAIVVTPFHEYTNKARELMRRDADKHGTCAKGVGEAYRDSTDFKFAFKIRDLLSVKILRKKLKTILRMKRKVLESYLLVSTDVVLSKKITRILSDDYIELLIEYYQEFIWNYGLRIRTVKYLEDVLVNGDSVVFEGSQGIMLDKDIGFPPYVTKTNISFDNAYDILKKANFGGDVVRVGVTRAYMTRHGQGPFVTEDNLLSEQIPDMHNQQNNWQQSFRIGWPDLVSLRYAVESIGGIDTLAVTNLDRFDEVQNPKVCVSYHNPQNKAVKSLADLKTKVGDDFTNTVRSLSPNYITAVDINIAEFFQDSLNVPLGIISEGATYEDKKIINPF